MASVYYLSGNIESAQMYRDVALSSITLTDDKGAVALTYNNLAIAALDSGCIGAAGQFGSRCLPAKGEEHRSRNESHDRDSRQKQLGAENARYQRQQAPDDDDEAEAARGWRCFEQAMAACARGSKGYELQVQVDNFKMGNAGAATLIGDRHEIAGEVKVVDPATKAVAAQYYVQESRGGGGLIGIAIMASGATGIARDYANAICKRVFYYNV